MDIAIISLLVINILGICWLLFKVSQSQKSNRQIASQCEELKMNALRFDERFKTITETNKSVETGFHTFKEKLMAQLAEQHISDLKNLQSSLSQGMNDVSQRILDKLMLQSKTIHERLETLNQTTETRLKDIGGIVDKRLSEGFEKTQETFMDVLKRLTLIDEAQKKITELSTNVVSLQEILADKRSRGAFGEVQLNSLIRNVLPEQHFNLQHTLKDGERVDCMLFLPKPTGNIGIDAKFPLENFQVLIDHDTPPSERKVAEQKFRQDIKHHIKAISTKYIKPGETAEGAIMFIPSEAIFAEIHAHYPELVELSQKSHVWLASPTTLMAILTTAMAVLKDEATQKQVHIIQEQLGLLATDFKRFDKRFGDLSRHIEQAYNDVNLVHKSATKIISHFQKIENVQLEELESA